MPSAGETGGSRRSDNPQSYPQRYPPLYPPPPAHTRPLREPEHCPRHCPAIICSSDGSDTTDAKHTPTPRLRHPFATALGNRASQGPQGGGFLHVGCVAGRPPAQFKPRGETCRPVRNARPGERSVWWPGFGRSRPSTAAAAFSQNPISGSRDPLRFVQGYDPTVASRCCPLGSQTFRSDYGS